MRQLTGRPVGQWRTDEGGHRWWFESGGLVLDFVYTGGIGRRAAAEQWQSPADLGRWLAERFPDVDAEVGERELVDALALRDAIASGVVAASRGHAPSPEDVDVINLFAATPDIPPSLAGGHRQAGRTTARVGQALSALARQAVELLGDDDRDRIRECAADDCAIVFYDESRSNNRRWCSMQRCGNRAKVRRHRARA